MRFLRTNTAVIITVGPFYDATDGITPETGLTITNERITMIADTDEGSAPTVILDNVPGATSGTDNDLNYVYVAGSPTGVNDAALMQLELTAANLNRLGRIFLSITDAANHVPVFHEFMILPAAIYDAFVLGTDVLPADLTQIGGDAQSATDLKDFADAGYDPATNKVQGVVLTDTLTTYTGNTPQTGDCYARLGAPAGASVSADIAAVKADTAAVLVDTAEIGAAGAGLTALASAADLATVAGYLDTEIAAILADTNELQTDWADGGRLDLLLDGAASAGDPWTTALPGAYGAGTAGNIVGNYIDAAVSSRLATAGYTAPDNASIAAILVDTADMQPKLGAPAGASISADIAAVKADTAAVLVDTTEIGAAGAGLTALASAADLATVASYLDTEIAAILADTNELQTDWADGGRLDLLLDGAASAGDPWTTALPGAYGAGTAGYIVGNNLDATVSSRLATAGYTAPDNASIAAILVDTADMQPKLGAPAGASISADIAAVKADTAAVLVDTTEIGAAGAGLTALASAADLATVAGYLDTEVAAIKAQTDLIPASPAAVGSAMTLTAGERTSIANAVNTTQMTESYRALGAAPTLAQAVHEIIAHLGEAEIVGTTKTINKLDGATAAETFTLDSDTAPTSITRAT